jgi:hypothetical protein
MTPIVDEKNYTVVGINGFRRGSLIRIEAFALARKMQEQMQQNGWSGLVKVYYRDGKEVNWKEEKC